MRGWVTGRLVVLLALAIAGCASIDRLPAVPYGIASHIEPLQIPYARMYADAGPRSMLTLAAELHKRELAHLGIKDDNAKLPPNHFLALSGGGDDGAFGAGLLLGWTARGDRPTFRVVTGISTGALSAPFAFLGPDYDAKLKEVYTETTKDRIFRKLTVLAALTGESATDTTPLKELISHYVDKEMIRRIGEEYDKGRLLLIATTNLDHGRSVIWNIGAIAKSPDPRSRELIVEVLRASAAIPGAFPPVMLDVTVDGIRYEEMHVDGGTIAQAFLYPPSFHLRRATDRGGITRKNIAYIIRNGRLVRPEDNVKRDTLSIAGQAIATMIASSGVNDIYRIYMTTKRDRVDFNLAYIDDDFVVPYKGPFDQEYMRQVFDYGFEKGKAGYKWHTRPPGYED